MELERLDAPQYLPISIVIADVNNLKSTNDTYGHDSGDLLIRRTAEGFRKACRENDIIARWGGDEFAILLPNTDADKAERIVGRIREQYRDVSVMDLPVSVSFGIATRTLPEQSLSSIMTMAEKQMYANKRGEKMR
ncbi:putative signaling protein [bioreactor metagenome]|uniref:Putative signaling protein n=1 Tax=bioreactor metagenome TaxID=1076179 RepID=A0A645GLL3_9ZZZZ